MVCSVLSTMVVIIVILVLVKYCKISSIVLTLVVGSQLPLPIDAGSILPWQVEYMYDTCQTLITGFNTYGMTDRLLQSLPHGWGKTVEGCEKLVAFYNDLHNDSQHLTPSDPLLQVQKPAEVLTEPHNNQPFPWLSFLNVLLATAMLGHSLYKIFRPITRYYGYEFKRCFSLYLFVYDGDNYTPIKVKTLRGHMHCYRIEDNRKDVVLTKQTLDL